MRVSVVVELDPPSARAVAGPAVGAVSVVLDARGRGHRLLAVTRLAIVPGLVAGRGLVPLQWQGEPAALVAARVLADGVQLNYFDVLRRGAPSREDHLTCDRLASAPRWSA